MDTVIKTFCWGQNLDLASVGKPWGKRRGQTTAAAIRANMLSGRS